MPKIKNILNKMENNNYQGYLLKEFKNIQYISNYSSTSFAFCIIKEEPVIYCSKMDLEIAKKTSSIDIIEFDNFSNLIKDLKNNGIKNLAIEPTLPFKDYIKFKNDFNIDSVDYINQERMIKTPEEITKITKATQIAQESLRSLDFTHDHDEKQLAHKLEGLMKEKGASSQSFKTILSSGSNTSLPHAIPSNKKLETPILIDWGAIFKGYCSDNTRTIISNEKQQEIYDIVYEAYNKAIKAIKPGVKCSEIDKVARDIITEYGYADNFIHSLGHGVGLDIHEAPNFSTKDETIIEKGMVMTVEPGIYLEDEFGVRLEDTVEVKNSAKVIGDLPMDIYL